MEDTHRDKILFDFMESKTCLNPCSNGRYSQSALNPPIQSLFSVLILVLMEDTHRENLELCTKFIITSLNPCSNGRYSQRQLSSSKVKSFKS